MHKRGHGRYALTEAWLRTGTVDDHCGLPCSTLSTWYSQRKGKRTREG